MRMKYLAGDLAEAIELARGRIPEILRSGVAGRTRSLGRLVITVEDGQPMDLIRCSQSPPVIYWSGRDGKLEVAGLGAADLIVDDGKTDVMKAVSSVRSRLQSGDDNARYFGGLRFDAGREVDDDWTPFGKYMFVLPRFELVRRESETQFVCNLILPDDIGRQTEIASTLEVIRPESQNSTPVIPSCVSRSDVPDRDGWRAAVDSVVGASKAKKLDKLVLARQTMLAFDNEVPVPALIETISGAAGDSYLFMIRPKGGQVFMGATPERLYRRRGREFRSDAIAGTRPRGKNPEEDRRLGLELTQSEKDLKEHRLVVDSVKDSLEGMTEDGLLIDGDPECLLKLATVQHLHTALKADLRPGVFDEHLLARIHPTAAVGGYPRRAVFRAIGEREAFDRGWYAGPVGWIGKDAAEFAVAIRSALVSGNRLNLYAGAGILAQSDAEAEWEELENKINGFMRVLGA